MRRAMLVAPWVLLAHLAPLSPASAAQIVSECVEVEAEAVAEGMSLKVHNTCDFEVRCELSWAVRCEGDAAEAAARPQSLTVRLAQAARKLLVASGSACGERIWEITDDHWECKQVR